MARRRMIDPLIWEDEHFGKISDKAKILFIACISNADDDGRLSGNPSNLRAIAFRFEDLSLKKIEELCNELTQNLKNFHLYNVNGCSYIQLGKWEEYQSQREDRRKPSKLPLADQMTTECQPNVCVSKDKLSKDKLREVNIYVDFEKSTLTCWNSFCDTFPHISKVLRLSDSRRLKLKKRFSEGFDLAAALKLIAKSKFLLGENQRKWKISFDWLIENDKNHLKVLEGKYSDHITEDDIRAQFGLKKE